MWELLTRGSKPYEGIEPTRMRRYLKDGNRLQKPSPMTPDFVYVLHSVFSALKTRSETISHAEAK